MSDAQFYFFAALGCLIAARAWRIGPETKVMQENLKRYQSGDRLGGIVNGIGYNWLTWVLAFAAARYFWLYLNS